MTWDVTEIPTLLVENYKGTGEPRLVINPADLYPAMIAHIRQAVGNAPDADHIPLMAELYVTKSDTEGAERLARWAYSISDEVWSAALTPRGEFDDDDPILKARGEALDCALAWYTRALRMECIRAGIPVPNRTINRDPDYRI